MLCDAKLWNQLVAILILCLLVGASPAEIRAATELGQGEEGIVVEEAGEGSALEKAGIRPGDVLLSWERLPNPPTNPEGALGEIESAFDWMWLELEEAPRGTVEITGRRGGEDRVFTVAPGLWEAEVRPRMPDAFLEDYLRGRDHLEAGETAETASLWEKVAAAEGAERLRCWMWLRLGAVWAGQREWEAAHNAHRSGLEEAREPFPESVLWRAIGEEYEEQSAFELAVQAYSSARKIREETWGRESLALAESLNDLGSVASARSNLDRATEFHDRALEIRQKLAPGSLVFVESLNNLGVVARKGGDLKRATDLYERALNIYQELAPDSLDVAAILNNLGDVAYGRGDLDRATDLHQRALEIQQRLAPDSLDVAESLNNLGAVAYSRGHLEQATELCQRALEIWEKLAPNSLTMAAGLGNLGVLASSRGDLDRATELLKRALEIRVKLAPDGLEVATSLNNLGAMASQRGDMDGAKNFYQRALEILEKLTPDSLDVASSLNNLGHLALNRGDLDRATELLKRSLEIRQKLAPDSLDMAFSLGNLGGVAMRRGDLDRATELFQGALEIRQKLAPDSLGVATSLNNLGLVAYERGDLDQATDFHQGALKIRQELAPDSLDVATSLNNLGLVAFSRGELEEVAVLWQGVLEILQELTPDSLKVAASLDNLGALASKRRDLDRAMDFYQRSLEISQKLAPDSKGVAIILNHVGSVAYERGNLDQATDFHQRALEIQQKLAPDSLHVAVSLGHLGVVVRQHGDLDQATVFFQRALELEQLLAPDSLSMATTLNDLGIVAGQRGNLDQATGFHQSALEIQQKLASDSVRVATTLHTLGLLYHQKNPPQTAIADDFLRRALLTLESQLAQFGGSHDVRAGFRVQYDAFYRDALEVQLDLKQTTTAFHTLERSRARSFLEQLAERDTVFTADVPEDLDRERRRLAVRFDRTQQQLGKLNPRDQPAQIDDLQDQLRQLRDEARDIEEEVRRTSPKLAALKYPQPLTPEAARSALDPGTLMLSYSVGKETTHLFVVARDRPLKVHTLPVGEKELSRQVEDFQVKTHRRGWSRRTTSRLELAKLLYKTLIEPTEDAIRQSDRLLMIPDGSLHLLPFAALVRETGTDEDRPWQYLVEWKPVHYVLSATVYAELEKQRRSGQPEDKTSLAAFGDPLYPQELQRADLESDGEPIRMASLDTVADIYVRSAAERGSSFPPLPYTQQEVKLIARLYPGARTYLGADATEERAKSIGKDVRILHFATHGTLDHRFPLNSAVALTIPEELPEGRDNGLLQAWEIFERVRLDADLVVLSACESGLGQQLGGEGLIGLTRAFQYAGARTVAATLWKVPDRTTAVLMERFYRHLKAGQPKDEALRAAQIELIGDLIEVKNEAGEIEMRDASAPYYWAAFQIYGDWQ